MTQSGGNEGIGFAIPSNLIAWVYKQLRQTGHVDRPTIGVGVQAITPLLSSALHLSRNSGVLITDVTPEGPADRAGLHVNDIILSIGEMAIDAVPAMLGASFRNPPGQTMHMKLLREGREFEVDIMSVPEPHTIDHLVDLTNPEADSIAALGIIGLTTNKKVEEMLGGLRLPLGVAVAARIPSQSGLETGLQTSDVIHAINGTFVNSVPELRSNLQQLKPGDPVALLIERGGRAQYLAFSFE
jgi:serine protease Do